mgnify:CR=1 FL=1
MQIFELLSIAPFHWSKVGSAILCGLIVGLERQLRGKPVGIRTSALIVLGIDKRKAEAVIDKTIDKSGSEISVEELIKITLKSL